MAIQILPGTGIGENLGKALGGGMQQAVGALMQQKLAGLMKQQETKQKSAFWQQLGFTPEVSMAIASQDPQTQKSFLDRIEGLNLSGLGQPQQGGGAQPQQPQPQQDPLSALQGQQQQPQQDPFASFGIPQYNAQIDPNIIPSQQQQALPGQQGIPTQDQSQLKAPGLTLGANPAERRHRENLDLKKQTLDMRKEVAGEKRAESRQTENKKDLQVALKTKENSQHQVKALDNMLSLGESGKLDHPIFVKGIEKLGLDWMLSPESQEYISESKSLFKDLKEIFGSRPIGIEFEAFMKSIPTLMNSADGRKTIAKNMKAYYQAKSVKADVMMDVLKKNKDISPLDLTILASEKTEKKINKIYEKLRKGVTESRELPAGFKMVWNKETNEPEYFKERN